MGKMKKMKIIVSSLFLLSIVSFNLYTYFSDSTDLKHLFFENIKAKAYIANGFWLDDKGSCKVCQSGGGKCDVSAQCCQSWGGC